MHVAKMANLGQWGTQVELFGAATMLRIEIYVFSKMPNCPTYKWLCYKPQLMSQNSPLTEATQKIFKLTAPRGYHIELIHSFGNHFDRVTPSDLLLTSMEAVPENPSTSNCETPIILP